MPEPTGTITDDIWEGVDDSIGFRAFIFILLAAVVVMIGVAVYRLGDWPWG